MDKRKKIVIIVVCCLLIVSGIVRKTNKAYKRDIEGTDIEILTGEYADEFMSEGSDYIPEIEYERMEQPTEEDSVIEYDEGETLDDFDDVDTYDGGDDDVWIVEDSADTLPEVEEGEEGEEGEKGNEVKDAFGIDKNSENAKFWVNWESGLGIYDIFTINESTVVPLLSAILENDVSGCYYVSDELRKLGRVTPEISEVKDMQFDMKKGTGEFTGVLTDGTEKMYVISAVIDTAVQQVISIEIS